MKIGVWELVLILVIVVILFGAKNLPKLGTAFGKTIGNFKKGISEDLEESEKESAASAAEDGNKEA